MRRRDKSKNIERANLLAEQRYLKSKRLLKENSDNNLHRMAGMLKSAIGARETPNWTDASDSHRNDMVYMSMLDGGVVGIAIPAPLGEDKAKYVQSKYNEIAAKSKESGVEFETKIARGKMGGTNKMPAYTMMIRLKGESQQQEPQQDDTINESGMVHAAGFADGGSGFEEGATMMQDNGDVLKEDSDTYFETLSATLDHVREMAKEMGYELDEDEVKFQFGTGGIPYEKNKSATILLLKDGEPIMGKSGKQLNRAIRVSIYRMGSGRYELTAYKTF